MRIIVDHGLRLAVDDGGTGEPWFGSDPQRTVEALRGFRTLNDAGPDLPLISIAPLDDIVRKRPLALLGP